MCVSPQPIITLDGSISHTFTSEGMHTVAVQVSSANSILQDTKTIAVQGEPLYSTRQRAPAAIVFRFDFYTPRNGNADHVQSANVK